VADAEAISEAAARPTMRFVAVKSAEKQASGMVFRTRDLLVRQRTQTINTLRGQPLLPQRSRGAADAVHHRDLPRVRWLLRVVILEAI